MKSVLPLLVRLSRTCGREREGESEENRMKVRRLQCSKKMMMMMILPSPVMNSFDLYVQQKKKFFFLENKRKPAKIKL